MISIRQVWTSIYKNSLSLEGLNLSLSTKKGAGESSPAQ